MIVVALVLPVTIGTVVVIYRSLNKNPDDLPTAVVQRAVIPPFSSVRFRVGDDPSLYCALLAQTQDAQELGMQHRVDLGGYDAMVFAFAQDTTVDFTNHFVPVDLSIGWFNSHGRLVDDAVMQACPSGQDCPTYASKDPYRFAIETLSGGLGQLGINARSVVHLGGSCS